MTKQAAVHSADRRDAIDASFRVRSTPIGDDLSRLRSPRGTAALSGALDRAQDASGRWRVCYAPWPASAWTRSATRWDVIDPRQRVACGDTRISCRRTRSTAPVWGNWRGRHATGRLRRRVCESAATFPASVLKKRGHGPTSHLVGDLPRGEEVKEGPGSPCSRPRGV